MNFSAFFTYVVVTTFTPGPNNIISMTNASKHGFKGAVPYNCGVFFGVMVVVSCCALFSSMLYNLLPTVEPYMRCVGAAYILWLAWNVWLDKPKKSKLSLTDTTKFHSGVLMQFINVKCYLFALTTMSSFVLPYYKAAGAIMFFVFIMAFMCLVGACMWALFGSAFEGFF